VGAIPDSTPDLAAIVDDAIQSNTDYCNAARRPRMEFHRSLPPGLRLPGTAKDWERVFVNLFLNAVQAIRKPGRIDISVDQGESLTITVADNGPGIPEDILPRIFRPNVTTKTSGGSGRSGLGLHIVASIIRKNGGKITATNRETGKGAIFLIQLPGD
jgi:signal transduction histidine kinase